MTQDALRRRTDAAHSATASAASRSCSAPTIPESRLGATDFPGWYQLYLLWGCRTEDYLEHLRGVRVDGRPLLEIKDIALTSELIQGRYGVYAPLAFLRGLLAEADAETLAVMSDIATHVAVTRLYGPGLVPAGPRFT